MNKGTVTQASQDVHPERAEDGLCRFSDTGGSGLPCLSSHNCDRKPVKLPGSDRKTAHALTENVAFFCELVGLERVGFLTLTTGQNLSYWSKEGWEEASKRFRHFTRRVIPEIFGPDARWVRIIEPTARGAIHWHLAIECPSDIRTGFVFADLEKRDYSSANPQLRKLWSQLRKACKAYGFGRHELLPIKSNSEAISQYVGKYISKGIAIERWSNGDEKHRPPKTRRLGYSRGWRRANSQIAWVVEGRVWRQAVKEFSAVLGFTDLESYKHAYGPRWAFHMAENIIRHYEEKHRGPEAPEEQDGQQTQGESEEHRETRGTESRREGCHDSLAVEFRSSGSKAPSMPGSFESPTQGRAPPGLN